jgi:cytochrome c oxidase subunit 2
MKFLIVIVVLLAVAAIAQAVKVHELAKKLGDKREEDINVADNNLNANLWIWMAVLLVGSFFYMVIRYKDAMLPEAASIHGVEIDKLMDFNMYIICAVFVLLNIVLMVFASKYRYKEGKRAFYYPHNNTLELIWTVIPALVMAVIIIYGLNVWNDITMSDDEMQEDAITVQLYGKQFDWTARYAGEDNTLGPSSFNFISGTNPLGIITPEVYDATLAEIEAQMATLRAELKEPTLAVSAFEEKEGRLERLQRQKVRIIGFNRENPMYEFAADDIVMDQGEFYLPVNREVYFEINSRDVIHSAFMPHFRMQMNAVPGMTTSFRMTPTITTNEMRAKTGNEEFDYMLMCNKICGAAHYNMKMTVKVVEEEEYTTWLSQQGTFVPKEATEGGLVENK